MVQENKKLYLHVVRRKIMKVSLWRLWRQFIS